MPSPVGDGRVMTPEYITLLYDEFTTHQQLYGALATCFAHVIWVILYFLIVTIPNPLNAVPSNAGPPIHVIFVLTILLLRDAVKITRALRLLQKLRKRIRDEALTRRMLNFPAYSDAVLHGFVEGFLASTLGHALAQAGDANAV